MIFCIGELTVNGIGYIDPIINVYFLSYNQKSGIYSIPQIIDSNLYPDIISPIDELLPILIDAPGSNSLNREQITEIVCNFLINQYPECNFFTQLIRK